MAVQYMRKKLFRRLHREEGKVKMASDEKRIFCRLHKELGKVQTAGHSGQ